MNKSTFLTESFVRRSLLLTLASILLLAVFVTEVTQSQTSEADAYIAYNKIAKSWIQKGTNQYNEGLFEEAEKSLSQAKSYGKYLNTTESKQLNELLEKTRVAAFERKRTSETYKLVAELIKQDNLAEAKAHLETLKNYTSLREEEQAQITEALKKINGQIKAKASPEKVKDIMALAKEEEKEVKGTEKLKETDEQEKLQKQEIVDLYYRSIGLYHAGQLENAREGFVKVAKSILIPESMVNTAEKYVKKIDETLAQKTKPAATSPRAGTLPKTTRPKFIIPKAPSPPMVTGIEAAEPVTSEGSYIEVVNRKRNILQSHTKAVVNDAIAKAQSYVSQGEFDKAQEIVASAELTVSKNQMYLGDILYKQCSDTLKQLSEKIDEAKSEMTGQEEQEKREAAIEAQHQFREQMEIEREEKIKTLMENARAYQKQQRYKAALGALESLLAIDPQNNDALILKDTLEDTIFFRKQLELEKEGSKQRADILLQTSETGVPYAEEIRYPKNWKEIITKPTRQPDEPIGLDPADAAVYEQLDKVVDLSSLRPTTRFSDAIEIIKNSVEPSLKIFVLWRDLEKAEIDQSTEINMDGLPAVRLGTGLENLLKAVSGGFAELGYAVENGVITIATLESLPSKLETRVYDITDIIGQPANYTQPMMMGMGMGGGGGGMYGGGGGGYGGGGGGYGGGGGGYGGGGGGYGGGGGGYGGGAFSYMQALDLQYLIEDAIESLWPNSWVDTGGDGSITLYPQQNPKKLVVSQAREIHTEIEKILAGMRKALGYQVSIEARFLVVSENFLEDIGLDVDFQYNIGGKWGLLDLSQTSAFSTTPDEPTKVPGSLGGIKPAVSIGGGYGSILDDLQVAFILRATQAHTDSKTLTAPKVTVLSGESASFSITNQGWYVLPVNALRTLVPTWPTGAVEEIEPSYPQAFITGTFLTITPTIMPDKKNVLLNIIAMLNELLRMSTLNSPGVTATGEVYELPYSLPETEISQVMTRVSVPDGGTLLLGGQKISAEIEKEVGVPILSKIPIIGRAFSNRSTVKDQKILLILVKPTIILQEEREAEAIAAMGSGF